MTNIEAIYFAAKVKVGSIIKANGLEMRVTEIHKDKFCGKAIYKGKDRGTAYLSFETLINPHYCKDIEVL